MSAWQPRRADAPRASRPDGRAADRSNPERPLLVFAEAGELIWNAQDDAGGRHADLHVGSLLICDDDGAPRACIADLDRARVTARVPAGLPG